MFPRILLCTAAFLLPLHTFAGGDISPDELAFHNKLCSRGFSGDSCLVLAEDTMCGRGFNEETYVFVSQAALNYKSNCQKGHAQSCYDYSLFMMSCLPNDMEFRELILHEYVSDQMFLSCPITFPHPFVTEEEEQQQIISISIDLLSMACTHNVINSCLILGELYSAEEVKKSKKATKVWEQACSLGSQQGCELLRDGSVLSPR